MFLKVWLACLQLLIQIWLVYSNVWLKVLQNNAFCKIQLPSAVYKDEIVFMEWCFCLHSSVQCTLCNWYKNICSTSVSLRRIFVSVYLKWQCFMKEDFVVILSSHLHNEVHFFYSVKKLTWTFNLFIKKQIVISDSSFSYHFEVDIIMIILLHMFDLILAFRSWISYQIS